METQAGKKATGGRGRSSTGSRTSAKSNPGKGQGTRGQSAQGSDEGTPQMLNGIEIEMIEVPGRGGRQQQQERYPFGALPNATKVDGKLVGPSFLIPEGDSPDNVLAVARKRHKGVTFISRKIPGQGTRVWRDPDTLPPKPEAVAAAAEAAGQKIIPNKPKGEVGKVGTATGRRTGGTAAKAGTGTSRRTTGSRVSREDASTRAKAHLGGGAGDKAQQPQQPAAS